MKMTLSYTGQSHLPRIEIEDTPEACVQFVASLAAAGLGPTGIKQAAGKSSAPAPVRERTRRPTRHDQDGDVRTYRGKPNRRHMVLEVFRALAASGKDKPAMEDIRIQYAAQFPEEAVHGLDQVIRDMVNKTNLIERLAQGLFQLRGNDRIGKGLHVLDDAF